jgi:hypothetical protein
MDQAIITPYSAILVSRAYYVFAKDQIPIMAKQQIGNKAPGLFFSPQNWGSGKMKLLSRLTPYKLRASDRLAKIDSEGLAGSVGGRGRLSMISKFDKGSRLYAVTSELYVKAVADGLDGGGFVRCNGGLVGMEFACVLCPAQDGLEGIE